MTSKPDQAKDRQDRESGRAPVHRSMRLRDASTKMKPIFATFIFAGLVIVAIAQDGRPGGQPVHDIMITRSGSQPSIQGPAEYFTGSVRVEPLFPVSEPSRISGACVTFEPGARTAWHTHPLGQTLIVTAGTGWVQQWSGPVEEMREGDVVRVPPGVKHWHGATATTRMTHIALQEQLDGKVVEWMEKVSDEQYRRP